MKHLRPLAAVLLLTVALAPAGLADETSDARKVARGWVSKDPAARAAAERAVAEGNAPFLRRVLEALRDVIPHAETPVVPAPVDAKGPVVHVETRILHLEAEAAKRLGLLDPAGGVASRPIEGDELRALLDAAAAGKGVVQVTAPSLAVYDRQKATVSVLDQISFIQDFDVEETGDGTTVADPIIGTIQEGVIVDLRPIVSLDRAAITCDLTLTVAHVRRPIAEAKVRLGTGEGTIQLPELAVTKHGSVLTLLPGRTAIVGAGRAPNDGSRLLAILVTAQLVP
jgi:hypothetical protein